MALTLAHVAVARPGTEHRARGPRGRSDGTHDALAQRAVGLDPADAIALGEVADPDYRLHSLAPASVR